MYKIRRNLAAFSYCLAILLITPGLAHAAPTCKELIRACEIGLSNGFRGLRGKMCVWYVTPCDCDASDPALPRVCLPDAVDVERIAVEVTEILKVSPEVQDLEADAAVANILSVIYPCKDDTHLRSAR